MRTLSAALFNAHDLPYIEPVFGSHRGSLDADRLAAEREQYFANGRSIQRGPGKHRKLSLFEAAMGRLA